MRPIPFDFIAHWIWGVLTFFLLLSGFSIIGGRFSWMMGNHFPLMDTVHRLVGFVWVIWVAWVAIYEVKQLITEKPMVRKWLPIGSSGFAGFNFAITFVLVITGVILWFMPAVPFRVAVVSFMLHELLAFVLMAVIVWHMVQKRHLYRLPLVKPKRRGRKQ
ncbi:hypothetical protein [Paenibacillus turpanensis]|uniref:hypothetical protein n=1 Tax=Paenibacillus turpanensis TaxID=2689078 RepID=UPI00140AF550|nr:hypothetical protein [Paenibacillus turpanensis]